MGRIVHLGLGNFHRAHQAAYTADAPADRDGKPWRITAVSFRNRTLIDALREQDHRYTLLEVGTDAAPPREMMVIDRTLLVAEDGAQAVIDAIADEGTSVVTLTVTEKGYGYRSGSHDLDTDDPRIAADLTGEALPATTVGILAAALLARARSHGAPIDLVSCDNIGHNGSGLRTVLTQYVDALPAGDRDALSSYLAEQVGTPNTMVDRIVPAATEETRAAARAAGFDDAAPVPAEHFTMWVIEDSFRAERPAWEAVGATLAADTAEVGAYEAVKLRLLNAENSMFAYLGLLTGRAYIAEAATDPATRAVTEALFDEMVPTIEAPQGFDVEHWREQTFRRFANRAVGHRTQQVGSDGSVKLAQRVPGPVAWHAAHGDPIPPMLVLLTAAWLRVIADWDEVAMPDDQPEEPARELVLRLAAQHPDATELARAVLLEHAVLGAGLAGQDAFVAAVGGTLAQLRSRPAEQVIEAASGQAPADDDRKR